MPKHHNALRCDIGPRHTSTPLPLPHTPSPPQRAPQHATIANQGVHPYLHGDNKGTVYVPPPVYPLFVPLGYNSKGGCTAGEVRGAGAGRVVSGVVYLASPYSHRLRRVREARYRGVLAVAVSMIRQGMVVYSPIVYGHQMAGAVGGDWCAWRNQDIGMLGVASVVAVLCLDGWRKSVGMGHEIEMAVSRGIPVQYIFPIGYKSKG